MQIPSITYSDYFGPISKVRWYSVTENFNEYTVNLDIQTNQSNGSQVRIENRANMNGVEWLENIAPNVTQQTLFRRIEVLHVPTYKAPEYVVINQAS
jgi:hypothetical protein